MCQKMETGLSISTADDGSELWINGGSEIQNYGMHGMREYSGTLNLTAGYHDFRIEFFQGGGPHGLKFSWEGPNVSKGNNSHLLHSSFQRIIFHNLKI